MPKKTDQYRQAETLADLLNTLNVRIDDDGDLYEDYSGRTPQIYTSYYETEGRWIVLDMSGANDAED